jgi:branched-chain amino acid transport system substrate-binding protein
VSIGAVLRPVGLENAKGIVSTGYLKDPTDKKWDSDAGMKTYKEFLAKYMADGDLANSNLAYGYSAAQSWKSCSSSAAAT